MQSCSDLSADFTVTVKSHFHRFQWSAADRKGHFTLQVSSYFSRFSSICLLTVFECTADGSLLLQKGCHCLMNHNHAINIHTTGSFIIVCHQMRKMCSRVTLHSIRCCGPACMLNTLEQVTPINSVVECVCVCAQRGRAVSHETNTVLLPLRPMTPTMTHLSGENDSMQVLSRYRRILRVLLFRLIRLCSCWRFWIISLISDQQKGGQGSK